MNYHYLKLTLITILLLSFCPIAQANVVFDDFEGNGTIDTWEGDDCEINSTLSNPFPQGINSSTTVLEYHDVGGQYANIRFDVNNNFELISNATFSFKIYVPSNGLTGNEPNQVSLKLQDGTINEPWTTQSEVIKSITLDQWQTVTFNFKTDNYININGGLPPPTERFDFNRVLIQVNGENNNSEVLAYIDDFNYDGIIPVDQVFNDLIWSDEFDDDGAINSSKWFHQTQLPDGGSWYNNEIQHYTDRLENTFVENGTLNVVAKKETFTDQGYTKQYTSARLNSKFSFKYGKVEIRAKLPSGVGTWPALWMLGKNINEDGAYWDNQGFGTTGWPACGEIDIMEHWGSNQNFVQSATHTPSSFGNTENHGGQTIPTASDEFHIYTLEWTEEKLIFKVDNVVHYIYFPEVKNASTWPFDAEQYLIFNVAIQPSIASNFSESAMVVDYVRVYQNNTTSTKEISGSNSLSYYPNPVYNELNIKLDKSDQQNLRVRIFSIDGILVKEMNLPINDSVVQINNLGELSKGMYLVNFKIENKDYSIKFIKN